MENISVSLTKYSLTVVVETVCEAWSLVEFNEISCEVINENRESNVVLDVESGVDNAETNHDLGS